MTQNTQDKRRPRRPLHPLVMARIKHHKTYAQTKTGRGFVTGRKRKMLRRCHMPFFMVRNLDGDWDGTQLINARNEKHAAQLWRRQRDVSIDHPVAVAREEMEYPEDEYKDEDEAG